MKKRFSVKRRRVGCKVKYELEWSASLHFLGLLCRTMVGKCAKTVKRRKISRKKLATTTMARRTIAFLPKYFSNISSLSPKQILRQLSSINSFFEKVLTLRSTCFVIIRKYELGNSKISIEVLIL